MKHLYLIILIALLYSCNNQEKENIEFETRLLEQKIEYFKSEIDKKFILNPYKIAPYIDLLKGLNSKHNKISLAIRNNDFEMANKELAGLLNFINSNDHFQNNYILNFIVPSRTNKWINKGKDIKNKDYLKLDLLKLKFELLEYLYHNIEKDYFKFNKLIPIVADSSNTVKSGEIYNAEIFLAAIDTTQGPTFIISDLNQPDSIFFNRQNNKHHLDSLYILGGVGIYKMQTRSPGKKGFKGMIEIMDSDGNINGFLFTHEFNVIDK